MSKLLEAIARLGGTLFCRRVGVNGVVCLRPVHYVAGGWSPPDGEPAQDAGLCPHHGMVPLSEVGLSHEHPDWEPPPSD